MIGGLLETWTASDGMVYEWMALVFSKARADATMHEMMGRNRDQNQGRKATFTLGPDLFRVVTHEGSRTCVNVWQPLVAPKVIRVDLMDDNGHTTFTTGIKVISDAGEPLMTNEECVERVLETWQTHGQVTIVSRKPCNTATHCSAEFFYSSPVNNDGRSKKQDS